MPPVLQIKLIEHLMYEEIQFFHQLFDFSDGRENSIPLKSITQILSKMECQFFLQDQTIIYPEKEFKHLYLIKEGVVRCYTQDYNYMYDLQERSFFGDYNIQFGLYSNIRFNSHLNKPKMHCIVIFKIESYHLMNQICSNFNSFKHLHQLSLQKLRFNNALINTIKDVQTQNGKRKF